MNRWRFIILRCLCDELSIRTQVQLHLMTANGIASTMDFKRQISAFAGAGVFASLAHYSVLIGAVELFAIDAVLASLIGFIAGGLVSYVLNRRLTFNSTRSHAAAGWRFALVAFGGFLLTGTVMTLLVKHLSLPYLSAQILTTLIVMVFTFSAHKRWSFGEGR